MKKIRDTGGDWREDVLISCIILTAGLIVGFLSSSVGWGIAGAALGFFIGLILKSHIWPIWMCGPRRDELRKALFNFTQKSFNKACIDMVVKGRRFKLYRKDDFDKQTYVFRLQLPWKHWQKTLQGDNLREQLEKQCEQLYEDNNGLCAEVNDEPDRILQMIDYVLDAAQADLDSLECHSDLLIFDIKQGGAFDN